MKIKLILLLQLFCICFPFIAKANMITHTLIWNPTSEIAFPSKVIHLSFQGAAHFNSLPGIPHFIKNVHLGGSNSSVHAMLREASYGVTTDQENDWLQKTIAKSEVKITAEVTVEKKVQYASITVLPFRYNQSSGRFEKLLSFTIDVVATRGPALRSAGAFASSSVLKSGSWYRVGLTRDGIYKLSYSMLKQMGMDTEVAPAHIRLYGNGGGMLPQSNSMSRPDDLIENAIRVFDENNNGRFDGSDYILFYGEGPDRWEYTDVDQRFHHKKHKYSDTTYYFITAGGAGKRVEVQPASGSPTQTVTSFDGFEFHENDKYNLIRSGSEWYGEPFEIQTTHEFTFAFSNIISSVPAYLKCDVIGRSLSYNSFAVSANGQPVITLTSPPVSEEYTQPYAYSASFNNGTNAVNHGTFTPNSSEIKVKIIYDKPTVNASGWLNYIELNVRQGLSMAGNQLIFRDKQSVAAGSVSEFLLGINTPSVTVWDVTDPYDAKAMDQSISGSGLRFVTSTSSLKEFVAFANTGYLTPVSFGRVENQDLHGLAQTDMLIISHPKFLADAARIADLHSKTDGLTVEIVTPQEIYNEFSSGSQDVSAIRDFIRMFYERATGEADMPKYVMIFGDGSYDPKNRVSANTNYVCTCESANSLSPTGSYLTDDFFVQLDPNEGNCDSGGNDRPDVAIGRLPVKTTEEAKRVTDKIVHYAQKGPETFRDWRNMVCLVADDGDGNSHLTQANTHGINISNNYKNYNIDKIFFDAYKMESTPGGQRYPDVNAAITQRINKGTLILNYTGHGGESGWAHERVLDFNMINSWKNIDKLPLFFTATCEFSRFDDPAYTSAGELVLLNGNGGAIALMTTTRLVYANNNDVLNTNFFDIVFNQAGNTLPPPIGEIFRKIKVASGTTPDNRNFTLLGDPALRLYYPQHNVVTTEMQGHIIKTNDIPVTEIGSNAQRISNIFSGIDTIKALSRVTIKGEIRDKSGAKLTTFNGTIYPTVYDKADSVQTLANKPESYKTRFSLRKNIIYKGKASVKNGDFVFSFVVPKDISYQYGKGRISYYAENGETDAAGHFEDFIIGGIDLNAPADNDGPKVKLYMNDEKFAFGGLTDENPSLFAILNDQNGINTVGNGIGHDITAVLDHDNSNIIILNDFYESDLDSYQSGKVTYPFNELKTGMHHLRIKVWDVYDNSSEAETEFLVIPAKDFSLQHVLNYPNPFSTQTSFYFEHNRPNMPMTAQVQVFTVTGKLIKTIEAPVYNNGFHAGPINWNGRDDYGDKLGKGVYIYRLRVKTGDGKYADKTEKLVILN